MLVGMLIDVQDQIFSTLQLLGSGSVRRDAVEGILNFMVHRLNSSPPDDFAGYSEAAKISTLFHILNRPLRVCGMVINREEPGGGPYWVREPSERLSLQIVENAQIDKSLQAQMAILKASTHFNPVELVCGLRDYKNQPFNLAEFTDPQAVFVSRKTEYGRELKALELPGLWNGAMASWNTVFVEIPEETFNPVKTINDLLRPGHRVKGARQNA
jgi:hypothetical protein